MSHNTLMGIMFCIQFLSWVFVYIMTEFKYLVCKRNCEKCGCWTCKYFKEQNVRTSEQKEGAEK